MSVMIVDASIAAAWMLVDEQNEATEAILDQLTASAGSVPFLFWYEARNLFLKAERRGRCTSVQTREFMRQLRTLPLSAADNESDQAVLALARAHSLSAYDAAYLDLAISAGLPLATSDRRLAGSARAEGVVLLGPFADGPAP